ncbi:MAG: hypothetical protein IKC47_02810 [Clostridia bacterium]|nr:hypothetical protein [Clostridia bacterium]
MKKSKKNTIVERTELLWVLAFSWLFWIAFALLLAKFEDTVEDEWCYKMMKISSIIHVVLVLIAFALIKTTRFDVASKKIVVKTALGCQKQEMLFEDIGGICLATTWAIRGIRNGIFVVDKYTWLDLEYESEPRCAEQILNKAVFENKAIWVYHSVKNRSIVNLCVECPIRDVRRHSTAGYTDL